MQRLIDANGEALTQDQWIDLADPTKLSDYSIIKLDDWQQLSADATGVFDKHKHLGLQLSGDLTLSELLDKLVPSSPTNKDAAQEFLNKFSLLQFDIAEFKDGRCFSLARRLRERLNYQGELRATGNYLPDQIYFMHRCGFNSFLIETKMDENTLRQTLKPFTEVYQHSGDDIRPVADKQSQPR